MVFLVPRNLCGLFLYVMGGLKFCANTNLVILFGIEVLIVTFEKNR